MKNCRATRLSGVSPFYLSVALLVIAVPSDAQVLHPCSAATSTYYHAYAHIVANIPNSPPDFWRPVTAMGNQTVPTGLAIWNKSGTHGPGVVSETMGYAMILAALYDDRATFDRLSATVQAGIKVGDAARMKSGRRATGFFPWIWIRKKKNKIKFSPAPKNPKKPTLDPDPNPQQTPKFKIPLPNKIR